MAETRVMKASLILESEQEKKKEIKNFQLLTFEIIDSLYSKLCKLGGLLCIYLFIYYYYYYFVFFLCGLTCHHIGNFQYGVLEMI